MPGTIPVLQRSTFSSDWYLLHTLSHTTTVSSASANSSRQGCADGISTPQDLFCQRTTTPCLAFKDSLAFSLEEQRARNPSVETEVKIPLFTH